MIKRRLEKLELRFPPSPANLLDRLDCRAMATLSRQERVLVEEVYGEPKRKKTFLPEHHAAVEQYSGALALLMQEISDDELTRLIAEVESRTGLSVSTMQMALA
jgi:hypothetical protein